MWGYYGSKSKIVKHYPKPKYDLIIEPFAGTAQYALEYWERDVILIDKYDIIVNLWRWLQKCSKKDILSTPKATYGVNLDDMQWDCIEQKHLIGFIIAGGSATPKKSPTRWKTIVRPNTQNYRLQSIANNLHKIRHWKIICGEYNVIKNMRATWFIDPPYIDIGYDYKHNYKKLNYIDLSEWCKTRSGQTLVCESNRAKWLDFEPLVFAHGAKGKKQEMLYIQET